MQLVMESDSDLQSDAGDSQGDTDVTESIWDRMISLTYNRNPTFWRNLLAKDQTQFRIKFKKSFLETSKSWLSLINAFVEDDEAWATIMETKAKLLDTVDGDECEGLLCAIDARRYKLFKLIDWETLEERTNTSVQTDESEEED